MMNKKHLIGEGFKHVFLMTLSLLCVFPFYWMIVGMTNSSADITMGKLTFGNKLVENITNAFNYSNLWRAFGNSLFLAVIVTGVGLLICSIAGYAFVVFPSRGKEILFLALIASMMVPFAAKIIPMFRMFSQLKMVNTMAAFMLPSISTPFMIMMFRQASRSFPHDIIEAARLDGLSETGIFFRMYMPTMKSTYAAATIITFMNAWNNYLWPKVILQNNESITMPMLVANLLGGYTVDYGVLMLGVFICTIPTAIIFFCFQKSFTEGITGAVK